MHIECTNFTPIVDTLDHLPPLPLFVRYDHLPSNFTTGVTEKDKLLGTCHALRLYGRVRHIELFLLPSTWHEVVALLDEQFPMLEHLQVAFSSLDPSKNSLPLTLPKAFLAPNLRHLALPSLSPPRRLRLLTSTVSLVTLALSNIQTSGYFRPRLLVARLRSLPLLEELFIGFSTPIPRPSTERKRLGEQGAPITLPSLKNFRFEGVSAYLESLIVQIRAPLLKRIWITLFNQIAFALPHSSRLINITEAFKLPFAVVCFDRGEVYLTTDFGPHRDSDTWGAFRFHVICTPLDWQIDCAAQICTALIPTLSCIENLRISHGHQDTPTELRNGGIDSATWHELLRSFIGLKELYITGSEPLLEELSRALQVDEVGSDPGLLPNLRSIHAKDNRFTSFIDGRRAVGRPVEFVKW